MLTGYTLPAQKVVLTPTAARALQRVLKTTLKTYVSMSKQT